MCIRDSIRMDGVESIPLTQQRLVMVVPRAFTDQIFGDRAEETREAFAGGADISAFRPVSYTHLDVYKRQE